MHRLCFLKYYIYKTVNNRRRERQISYLFLSLVPEFKGLEDCKLGMAAFFLLEHVFKPMGGCEKFDLVEFKLSLSTFCCFFLSSVAIKFLEPRRFLSISCNSKRSCQKRHLSKKNTVQKYLSCRHILCMELLSFIPIKTQTHRAINVWHYYTGKRLNGVTGALTFPIHIL